MPVPFVPDPYRILDDGRIVFERLRWRLIQWAGFICLLVAWYAVGAYFGLGESALLPMFIVVGCSGSEALPRSVVIDPIGKIVSTRVGWSDGVCSVKTYPFSDFLGLITSYGDYRLVLYRASGRKRALDLEENWRKFKAFDVAIVHDLAEKADLPYLGMRRVDGESRNARLDEHPLSFNDPPKPRIFMLVFAALIVVFIVWPVRDVIIYASASAHEARRQFALMLSGLAPLVAFLIYYSAQLKISIDPTNRIANFNVGWRTPFSIGVKFNYSALQGIAVVKRTEAGEADTFRIAIICNVRWMRVLPLSIYEPDIADVTSRAENSSNLSGLPYLGIKDKREIR